METRPFQTQADYRGNEYLYLFGPFFLSRRGRRISKLCSYFFHELAIGYRKEKPFWPRQGKNLLFPSLSQAYARNKRESLRFVSIQGKMWDEMVACAAVSSAERGGLSLTLWCIEKKGFFHQLEVVQRCWVKEVVEYTVATIWRPWLDAAKQLQCTTSTSDLDSCFDLYSAFWFVLNASSVDSPCYALLTRFEVKK